MLAVDNDFKISVLLGVAGTFLFFFSLSGFLLELAKRSKKFYYNGWNSTSLIPCAYGGNKAKPAFAR